VATVGSPSTVIHCRSHSTQKPQLTVA